MAQNVQDRTKSQKVELIIWFDEFIFEGFLFLKVNRFDTPIKTYAQFLIITQRNIWLLVTVLDHIRIV